MMMQPIALWIVALFLLISPPRHVQGWSNNVATTRCSRSSSSRSRYYDKARDAPFQQPSSSYSYSSASPSRLIRFMSDIPSPENSNTQTPTTKKKRTPGSPYLPDESSLEDIATPPMLMPTTTRPKPSKPWWSPPPLMPENHVVLTGDLLALSVYGFADHFLCQTVATIFWQQQNIPTLPREALSATTDGISNAASMVTGESPMGMPVWMDVSQGMDPYAHVLHVQWQDRMITQYSPALEPVGLAVTLLVTCWLVAGWWHGAFLWRNTTSCSTTRAIRKTGQTWLTSTILLCSALIAMTVAVNGASGANDAFSSWWQLTKGDLAYIMDSLTVLVIWRFMANWMLGGINGVVDDDEDDNDGSLF